MREIVGAEREEIRELGELAGDQRRPRHLDHRADRGFHLCAGPLAQHRGDFVLDQLPEQGQLSPVRNQRQHDLGLHAAARAAHFAGRLDDRAHLHAVDLGERDPEPAAAVPEHRVELLQLLDARAHHARVAAERLRHLVDLLIRVGQELVQRRVEQPNCYWQAGHLAEDPGEIAALHGQQLGERAFARGEIAGEDHLAHRENAARLEEHVLGAAEPDALGAERAREARIRRRVGVRAHFQRADLVRPAHQIRERSAELGCYGRHLAAENFAGRAVERDPVAGFQHVPVDAHFARSQIDAQRAAARDAALAHAARHHRCVRGHAAARGENAFGGVHAVNVVR